MELAGDQLRGVRDSKTLSHRQREELSEAIMARAIGVGIGIVHHGLIERYNVVGATRLAMRRSLRNLAVIPEYLLIDHLRLPDIALPQRGITDGDAKCLSIACASIMAKVTRDRIMKRFDIIYPGYGLAAHKGYGTHQHMDHLRRLGPCPIHRRSFKPIHELLVPRLL
jgi:ribonuclease HII